jgi:plasmid stabilization system protein ParE
MKIRYTVLAREELTETLEYYEAEAGIETAVDFFAEFKSVKSRIAANPRSFPEIRRGVRRCLFNRFPYEINYEIVDATTVKILVIKHQKRSPDFGLDR